MIGELLIELGILAEFPGVKKVSGSEQDGVHRIRVDFTGATVEQKKAVYDAAGEIESHHPECIINFQLGEFSAMGRAQAA